MNWDSKFLQGAFSESDGKPSFTRCVAAIVTTFALGWVTTIVIHNLRHGVVPVLPDFAGLIGFVSIFYGINQLKSAITNFSNKGNTNGQGS